MDNTENSVVSFLKSVWGGILNNVFALLTVAVTAIAAPIIINYLQKAEKKAERETNVLQSIIGIVGSSPAADRENIVRLQLVATLVEENKGLFDVQCKQTLETLQIESKKLQEEAKLTLRLEELENTISEYKDKVFNHESEIAVSGNNILDLQNQLNSAGDDVLRLGEEKERLNAALQNVKEESNAKAINLREDYETISRDLEERKKNESAIAQGLRDEEKKRQQLESELEASRVRATVARESKDALLENQKDLEKKYEAVLGQKEKLEKLLDDQDIRLEEYRKLVVNAASGYWVYLGTLDVETGGFRDMSVKLDGEAPGISEKKKYEIVRSANIRNVPTMDPAIGRVLGVVDKGSVVKFDKISTFRKGALWGLLNENQTIHPKEDGGVHWHLPLTAENR